MKWKVIAAFFVLVLTWFGHREYQIIHAPRKPAYTESDESSARKADIKAQALYIANPNSETQATLMKADGKYDEINGQRLQRHLSEIPYRDRVRVQIRSAFRDLLTSLNIFQFARGLRHALLPCLDRPDTGSYRGLSISSTMETYTIPSVKDYLSSIDDAVGF